MASILLIVTGSIAAVKTPDIIRELKADGHEVSCVLTKAGEQFVTKMALASLTGRQVHTDLFDADDEAQMGHINLSRAADMLLVAPASADIMAKAATGMCNDLASTLLLATNKPVMMAPAMNVKMWEHPATQRNVETLIQDGVQFVDPESGELACGETGAGRMAEPRTIVDNVSAFLSSSPAEQPLKGKTALVTSGPTVEALDPVRYIANRSSGKQGYAIAESLAAFGAKVTLVSGPTNLPQPAGVNFVQVESAREMLDACMKLVPTDIAVCAAAVADWRASEVSNQKIKKTEPGQDQTFTFMENPDILECISKHESKRPGLVVGFAAETENILENAQKKRHRKGCDWILTNDVSGGKVFGENHTHLTLIREDESMDNWGKLSKLATATKLSQTIAEHLSDASVVSLKGKKRKASTL